VLHPARSIPIRKATASFVSFSSLTNKNRLFAHSLNPQPLDPIALTSLPAFKNVDLPREKTASYKTWKDHPSASAAARLERETPFKTIRVHTKGYTKTVITKSIGPGRVPSLPNARLAAINIGNCVTSKVFRWGCRKLNVLIGGAAGEARIVSRLAYAAQIKDLERQSSGVQLFARTPQGALILTPAGAIFSQKTLDGLRALADPKPLKLSQPFRQLLHHESRALLEPMLTLQSLGILLLGATTANAQTTQKNHPQTRLTGKSNISRNAELKVQEVPGHGQVRTSR